MQLEVPWNTLRRNLGQWGRDINLHVGGHFRFLRSLKILPSYSKPALTEVVYLQGYSKSSNN